MFSLAQTLIWDCAWGNICKRLCVCELVCACERESKKGVSVFLGGGAVSHVDAGATSGCCADVTVCERKVAERRQERLDGGKGHAAGRGK